MLTGEVETKDMEQQQVSRLVMEAEKLCAQVANLNIDFSDIQMHAEWVPTLSADWYSEVCAAFSRQ